jgi:TRAP-type C4-dicarboxylate transport system permease small subunit
MLATIHNGFEKLSKMAVWIGGASLLGAALMVSVDVICRKFFSITMSGSDEYSGYVFAASTTWAYSYCLLHRSNVRIDALYNLLPRKICALLDFIGLMLLLYFMAIMTYHALIVFWDATICFRDAERKCAVAITTLGTPQWIPLFFWVFGLVMFIITLSFLLLYVTVALCQRNWVLVSKLAGIPSVVDTIEEETQGVDVLLSTKENLINVNRV